MIWPIDIRFVQTDAPSYAFQTVSSVFTSAEEEMKRNKVSNSVQKQTCDIYTIGCIAIG